MNTNHAGRGFSLLEVMIALLVVTFGIIGILKFQGELFQSGAVSKQRTIATALAQERMEELRAYLNGTGYAVVESLDGSPNNAAVVGVFGPSGGEQFQRDGTTFTRLTRVRAQTLPTRFLDVEVLVDWTTPTASDERVTLRSAVAWVDPINSAIIMSDPAIVATGSCPTASVQDGLCVGTAPSATDGQSVSVSYTQGGSGSGQWLCQGGVWFSPDPSACLASCPQQVVSSGVCSGTAAPTPYGQTTTVSFSSGGTGGGVYSCDAGTWVPQSGGTCNPGCNLPWGGVIANGASVTAYQSAAPSNVSCGDISNMETRQCNNGSLSGSFQFATCSRPCLAADHGGDFGNLAHGTTIEVYELVEAPTCDVQERTCTDGLLTGFGTYSQCTPTANTECAVAGEVWPANSARPFFQKDSAPDCSAGSAAFICDGEDGWFKRAGQRYTESAYRFPTCLEDPCTYALTITTPTNRVFCGSGGGAPTGQFPAGATCALQGNHTIRCAGEFPIDTVFSVSPVIPQRKNNVNQKNNQCSATTVACSPSSLTCSVAAENFAVSCSP